MSALAPLRAAVGSGDERAIRRAALELTPEQLTQAWDEDLLTVGQVQTVQALRHHPTVWRGAQVPA